MRTEPPGLPPGFKLLHPYGDKAQGHYLDGFHLEKIWDNGNTSWWGPYESEERALVEANEIDAEPQNTKGLV